jgi:hypothetical protein
MALRPFSFVVLVFTFLLLPSQRDLDQRGAGSGGTNRLKFHTFSADVDIK